MKVLTPRNMISNGDSFWDSETVIRFVASKWVWKWSRILISSPTWPYTQKEAQLNYHFHSFPRKMWFFVNKSKHRHIKSRWKSFFTMINNTRSLSQNMALFGSTQLSKSRQFCVTMRANNLATFVENGGNHYQEEAKRNYFAPRDNCGVARGGVLQLFSPRLPLRVDHRHGWHTGSWEAAFPFSSPLDAHPPACAPQRLLVCSDRKWQPWKGEKLRERRRESREM